MSTWEIVGAAWLGAIVLVIAWMALNARRRRKATAELRDRRSLTRLSDRSSVEQWRRAAQQSQAASDARRENGKPGR